ncbi:MULTISPECIES: DNA-processing protein DprA [unclassified Leucobacter]|uniref:DNA-processing protein DprA n=1 Tax=unclassified Leucobacter TaxID=2621730 RepID=UPI00165DC118|nr:MULTISPECIES: DNA-processing protein DprA [unclassified Leucobacter]MBC9935507.1 DNA-processing protein DprA [Leucobacter sp. cx-87]
MIPLAANAETRRLLEGVHPAGAAGMAAQHGADELLARAAWSRIAEPGDRAAGVLVAMLGAPALLAHLVAGSTPAEIVADAWRDPTEARRAALDPRSVRAAVERWRPRLSHSATLRDLEQAAAAGLRLLVPGDPNWPARVDDLGDHAPLALWVRGDPGVLHAHGLAVVGARASSGYGENVTAEIVGGVCDAGAVIFSGAAYGIDAVAHRAALAAGATTIAVLAGGADRAYPAAHATLIDRIAEQGAVCSEIIPGGAPTRWRFLHRKSNNKCRRFKIWQ